jgi:hypothetical protein
VLGEVTSMVKPHLGSGISIGNAEC